jgi:phosphatidylglycerophosphate synthase
LRADRQLAAAMVAQLALLGGLSATTGLGVVGWLAGIGYAAGLTALLAAAVRRHQTDGPVTDGPATDGLDAPGPAIDGLDADGPATDGPVTDGPATDGLDAAGPARGGLGVASLVTLARAVLVGGVTSLVAAGVGSGGAAGSAGVQHRLPVLVGLAVAALLLDAVDGQVARRTGVVSALGARFDMEVDAFLILVLSVQVAGLLGRWVLAIGLMRYGFLLVSRVLGRVLPWLRAEVPSRFSAKLVAAVQGIVLVAVSSGLVPQLLVLAVVGVALVALIWSFSQDVRWLWRAAHGPDSEPPPVLAGLVVFAVLLAPHQLSEFGPAAFARIPGEALFGVLVLLLLPSRARRVVALLGGVVLGLVMVLTLVNAGFLFALARPFHPVIDWALLDDAAGFVRASLGPAGGVVAVLLAGIVLIAGIAVMVLSALRLSRFTGEHRTGTTRAVLALAAVWLVCVLVGAELVRGVPVAAAGTAVLARDLAGQVRADLHDRDTFAGTVGLDPFRDESGADRLIGLRGKDVMLTFIESYGRSAVEDPTFAPQVDAELDDGTRKLAEAGFAARSGYLTSPTSGGGSWLAHSTLSSGMWINNQERYQELVGSDRLTLNRAFRQAGWRTVGVLPGLTTDDWPEGRFYDYDQVYAARHLGYYGPYFSFAPMPDQFTLRAFENFEHGKPDRSPLFAEVVLISSHAPWSPLPRMLGWNDLGDGSVFDSQAGPNFPTDVILTRNPTEVRADYRASIEYSLQALISYVQTYGDDRLVLVFLGDHQPAPVVVGAAASRDVPITIVTRDRAVLDRISGWGWSDGLKPAPNAPVWPMDTFRDRFLIAFGTPVGSGLHLSAPSR